MKTFETNGEFKKAIEKAIGKELAQEQFIKLIKGRHPPYDEMDLEEVVGSLGVKPQKTAKKKIPQVIQAISEELALWQEIHLRDIDPQAAKARTRLLGSEKVIDVEKAEGFLTNFFEKENLNIRPAYIAILLERSMLPRDYSEYLETMKPNDDEYFLAIIAFVMNRAYLSAAEAMIYILTGNRVITPGLFNPLQVLVSYRLALYLQPPGQPSRSLLSEKERALLRLVGMADETIKAEKLWMEWNHKYPEWAYSYWRLFWKSYDRAKNRLLSNYSMPVYYDSVKENKPEHFWEWLKELNKKA